ncbi:MAG: NADH-quinone oxidoreductase subunit NuoF [Desulfobacterales bacterium]|nr:MAG: NADH-quinone oxidoreductase subunit NuoF [Desulfobacterales bacterium]
MSQLRIEDLNRIKAEVLHSWQLDKRRQRVRITVHMGTCGISSGADKVLNVLQAEIEACRRKDIAFTTSGCAGICNREPLVTIEIAGQEPVKYCEVDGEKARRIFEQHVIGGQPVAEWVFARGWEQTEKDFEGPSSPIADVSRHVRDIPFFGLQKPWVMRNRGLIQADKIEEYIARDGYAAAAKALFQMTPDDIIGEVKTSGIRGRGGAGFPTGLKWEFAARSAGDVKYVLCNADEGDPGAFMDRCVLESDPHAVLEGMIIAARAIGSHQGYIYCRAEYPLAVRTLNTAIDQARKMGLLGQDILGSGFGFDVEVYRGAGAFVCGEETALMTSIEGKRGTPRPRPPFPAVQGLWKKPTILNNVETLANIAQIILNGGQWYAGVGTLRSKGTKVFAITGDVNNVGLVEVPMGIPLQQIIYDIGGGISEGRQFKAVQLGGPSGGCVPAQHLDVPVDYESITQLGAIVGSGGMIVMDEDKCMVDVARFFMDFCTDESCGKCAPCRAGTTKMLKILNRACEGNGKADDIQTLEKWATIIQDTALCGLGQTAPNPVLSTLRYFRHEYESHILAKRCPTGVCRPLVIYHALEDQCLPCLQTVAGYDAGGYEVLKSFLPELVPERLMTKIENSGCAVDLARFSMMAPIQNNSCTKCVTCRLGGAQVMGILEDIASGRGKPQMLDMLTELTDTMRVASECPVGKTAGDIVLLMLEHFGDQFETHIRDGACPGGICRVEPVYHTICPLRAPETDERRR